jgi:hypothetical protein
MTYWAWVTSLEAMITPSTSTDSMRLSADGSAFAPETRDAIISARLEIDIDDRTDLRP